MDEGDPYLKGRQSAKMLMNENDEAGISERKVSTEMPKCWP